MSALDGVLEVGDLVWQQMYSPSEPSWDATIEERVAGGVTYGARRLMRLVYVVEHFDSNAYQRSLGMDVPVTDVTRWGLAEPGREGDRDHFSHVESDWCVLEHAEVEGALF